MQSKNPPITSKIYTPSELPQRPEHRVRGTTTTTLRTILRALQFTTSLVILGIYSSEIHHHRHRTNKNPTDPITDEIYALVVSLLSLTTIALHCLFTRKWTAYVSVPWDLVVSVLWAALAGRFGSLVFDGEGERAWRSVRAMRVGVGFGLLGVVLWLLAFVLGCAVCCRSRNSKRRDLSGDLVGGMETGLVRTVMGSEDGGAYPEESMDAGRMSQRGEEKLAK
ncbi:hypothetical protein Q7P37_010466 [Cladosporium fusiforme]